MAAQGSSTRAAAGAGSKLRTVSGALALVSGAISASVLVGWALDIPTLKSVLPALVNMKANTALGVTLIALALWLSQERAGRSDAQLRQKLARVTAVVAAALGLLTLSEHIFGWNLGIDQLLFPAMPDPVATSAPGRMAVRSCILLVLLGVGLYLLNSKSRLAQQAAQFCALAGGLISYVAVLGYFYGIIELYDPGSSGFIAVQSTFAFFLLSLGLLCAVPEQPPMAVFTQGSFASRMAPLLVVAFLAPAILGSVKLQGEKAGLFGKGFGVAMIVGVTVLAVLGLLYWTARSVNRMEEERTQASGYARSLIEASLDPLVTISPDGKITDVNEATIKVTGVAREKLIGTDFSSYFTQPGKAEEGYQHVFAQGSVTDYPLTIRHVDGRLTDVLYNASVYRDARGNVRGVFAAARDVTAQKQTSDYARSLIEASLDPLVTISPDGKITDVNEATIKVTGVAREKLIGTDFSNYFTEPGKAQEGYQQVFAKGLVTDYPLTIRHLDGRLTDVLYNASVYRDARGNVRGVFAAARDVTRRKQAEQAILRLNAELEQRVLDRTAQLAASNQELEGFSYSVAHDLRAPLRHVNGFSKILLEDHGPEMKEEARQLLERVCEGAQHMGTLIDELLNFSRMGRRELQRQITGLNSLVEEARAGLRTEGDGRSVEWRVGRLPYADCDPALMKQVFANLLSNALKFTRPREQAVIEVGQFASQGQTVLFVRDNGVGFDMKYADKLFGVFQRLHRSEDFEGTGVGLALVQKIVHKHGGRVWAEGTLEHGATFFFTLGAAETAPQPVAVETGGAHGKSK